jgi:hypothetical protein
LEDGGSCGNTRICTSIVAEHAVQDPFAVNQKVPFKSVAANQVKARVDANGSKDIGAAESILLAAALLDSLEPEFNNAPYNDGLDGAGLHSVDEILN